MSPRRWEERINDILNAIAEINSFVDNMEFSEFQKDTKTIRAVELNFIVIGEAANRVPQTVQDNYPDISWHLMRGLRNQLVHAYFQISPNILWNTINHDLPPLVLSLMKILDESNDL